MEVWAEAGQCEGDVEYALDAAKAIKDNGGDAIKVQLLRPETLVAEGVGMYDRLGTVGTQREVFASKAMEYEDWGPVLDYCRDVDLEFVPSVFDFEAVEWCEANEVTTLKIASGDLTYHDLIEAAASVSRRIVLSTGGAVGVEVEDALETVMEADGGIGEVVLLACHLEYPTQIEDAQLGRIGALWDIAREFEDVYVGYSDHTREILTTMYAVMTGAVVHEKHFTLWGPGHGTDHEFAVDPAQLRSLVRAKEEAERAYGYRALVPQHEEVAALRAARRSWHVVGDVIAGQKLTASDLVALRPWEGGIRVDQNIVGLVARERLEAGSQIPPEWLEG